MEIMKMEIIVNILSSIFVAWMACETRKLAEHSKKHVIAAAEAHIMPKIVPNMRSKNETSLAGPLVSFDFYENRPYFPIIRVRREGKEEWEKVYKADEYSDVEVKFGKTTRVSIGLIGGTNGRHNKIPALVWHSSAPDDIEKFLEESECPISLDVQIEFNSYSGELYKYQYSYRQE